MLGAFPRGRWTPHSRRFHWRRAGGTPHVVPEARPMSRRRHAPCRAGGTPHVVPEARPMSCRRHAPCRAGGTPQVVPGRVGRVTFGVCGAAAGQGARRAADRPGIGGIFRRDVGAPSTIARLPLSPASRMARRRALHGRAARSVPRVRAPEARLPGPVPRRGPPSARCRDRGARRPPKPGRGGARVPARPCHRSPRRGSRTPVPARPMPMPTRLSTEGPRSGGVNATPTPQSAVPGAGCRPSPDGGATWLIGGRG